MTYSEQRRNGKQPTGTVLIVDDEATLLVALERAFAGAGYYALTASSVESAWLVLDSWVVHCVVADERLPDGSGAYFLADVGRKFGGIGRVLLTAYLDENVQAVALAERFPALDKECSFPELLAAVREELVTHG